jgi:hypothetical protein
MRVRTVVAAVLACSTFASAQPGADLPPPEEQPPPPPAPAPAPEPPVVSAPPGTTLPPINITITNNNNGNNSNTNSQTNSQTNEQTNSQANPQTNTQTNTVPVTVTTSINAPGAVAPITAAPRELVGRYELIKPHRTTQRWITLGFSRSGVRTSIDLLGRGPFTIGIAATVGGGEHHDRGGHPEGGAVAYLAYTRKLGRFDVRASLGIGVGPGDEEHGDRHGDIAARTTTGTDLDDNDGDGHGHRRFSPRAEAALLIGLPLTKRLGLLAGPVISTTGRGHSGGDEHERPEVTKAVMAGLRFRF